MTEIPVLINSLFCSVAEQFIQFREGPFDRVQIECLGRRVTQLGIGSLDDCADPGHRVTRSIVHPDDVAGLQGGSQMLFEPNAEQRGPSTVSGAVNPSARTAPRNVLVCQ